MKDAKFGSGKKFKKCCGAVTL
ncbi:SEC-C metal-binding domain-containing protein [Virgibacillus natechei]